MPPLDPQQLTELARLAQALNSPAALVVVGLAVVMWILSSLVKLGVIPTKQERLLGQIARDAHDTLELMKRQLDYREAVQTLQDLAWGRTMSFRSMVRSDLMNFWLAHRSHPTSEAEIRELVQQAFSSAINYVDNLLEKIPSLEAPALTRTQKLQTVVAYLDSLVQVFQNPEFQEKDAIRRFRALVDIITRNSNF